MSTIKVRLDPLLHARVSRIARSLRLSEAAFIRDAALLRAEALEEGDRIARHFFDVEMADFDDRLRRLEHGRDRQPN